jgi:hypothetical protein
MTNRYGSSIAVSRSPGETIGGRTSCPCASGDTTSSNCDQSSSASIV